MFLNFPKREGNSPGLTDGQRYKQLTLYISSSNRSQREKKKLTRLHNEICQHVSIEEPSFFNLRVVCTISV